MKYSFRQRTFKVAATLVLAGVFLCIAGPIMVAGGGHMMSGSTTCQAMHVNLAGLNPDGKPLGILTLFLFGLSLIHSFSRRGKSLVQEVATALSPPRGSRWRLFQHAFFDTFYRQFSPARQYAAVVVEPQMYSV